MRTGVRVLAVVGALALVVTLLGIVAFGSAARGGFSARDQPSKLESVIAPAMLSWSIPARAKALRRPAKAGDDSLADARAHWANHCASCHANNGSGDTEMGKGLYPKTPDMRMPATQSLSDGELYFIIENGVRLTGMPAWGKGGDDDQETWSLVAFIRHLPSLTTTEEQQMERLNPKSPEDRQEEDEEEQFLKGDHVRTNTQMKMGLP